MRGRLPFVPTRTGSGRIRAICLGLHSSRILRPCNKNQSSGWRNMIHHAVSVVGFIVFAGIAWLLSSNRRKIAWKTIAWAAALQLLIGLIIFRLPGTHRVFLWLNNAVLA